MIRITIEDTRPGAKPGPLHTITVSENWRAQDSSTHIATMATEGKPNVIVTLKHRTGCEPRLARRASRALKGVEGRR